ncbi:MAG: pyruvate kinase [Peptococcaceae bacterium]|jgi:pyruvate kinase|nr:pyruvate kinase [Peptococcaceae bacterium]
MRRTKIVCTIGPASETNEKVQQLLQAGMDVARLNFSHGTHEEHGARIKVLRQEANALKKHLGILLDTKGPEIRSGQTPVDGVILENGAEFTLDTSEELGSPARVGISYADLWKEVEPGGHILIDDGLIDLEVTGVAEQKITTVVKNGGLLQSKKGINVPGVKINLPAVTAKDEADILFGIREGIDYIAASFTRKAEDILAVRRIVEREKAAIQIIAKIENQEGVDNLEAILQVADGLMVARGDLGVEVPVEDVPVCQKKMIELCNLYGKPVIVATQMLDSMIRQPRPTRAEASDVANAILDGTDAIMLSGETASGQFPVEAVQMMDKIARKIESQFWETKTEPYAYKNMAEAIGHASSAIAKDLDAAAVITPTQSGLTARLISKYRPKAYIVAATPYAKTARSLSLQWGVYSVVVAEITETDQMLSISVDAALTHGFVKTGDVVVITAGVPVGQTGTTNLIKVQIVGKMLAKGMGIGRKSYSGVARHLSNFQNYSAGDILVADTTDANAVPIMQKAGAIVVQEGGLTSHAAVVALQFGIPAVIGARNALNTIQDGEVITVDALSGVIYEGQINIL